jgi:AbrB family looped-hinge helix DNA binding protein
MLTIPVDNFGRVCIPVHLRREYNIQPGDRLEVTSEYGILLTPVKSCCAHCGNDQELLIHHAAMICRKCAEEIASCITSA